MKDIFLYLRQLVKLSPSIRWFDLEKGQLSNYEERPPIDFPAVLVNIEYPSTSKVTGKQQQCTVTITVDIAFDFMDDTSSITPDNILEKSLEVFDIADEVHEILQGAMDVTVIRTPLERTSVRSPKRADGIKILQYVYSTKSIE